MLPKHTIKLAYDFRNYKTIAYSTRPRPISNNQLN